MPNPAVYPNLGRVIRNYDVLLRPLQDCGLPRFSRLPVMHTPTEISNTANLTGGENVGGSTAAPAAPEVASDDDGGDGDGDPDPERQTHSKRTRTSRKSTPPAAILARPKDACTLLGIGRTKLHHLSERDPRFPRKIVLGARCVGWRIDALHDYLRTCELEG